MTGKEIVKMLMEEETVTNAQLANKLGITQATVWARLNNQTAKDFSLTVFNEMLGALGYEIVIRKKSDTSTGVKEIAAEIDAPMREETRGRPRNVKGLSPEEQ